MLTSLDWLIIVFMILAALALLSLALMFLIKNKTAKKVFFYIVSALAVYLSSIGLRIGFAGYFPMQIGIGVLTVLASIGAFVFEIISKGNDKRLRIARIAGAASLVIAFMNAFIW